MVLEKDKRLGSFRLVDKLGEGGMGVVWKALDTSLDRPVAVKILPDAFAADEQRLARFAREARLLATLSHAHIAAIYGLHHEEGVHFLSMELVDGENLAQRLARGPLGVTETLEIAGQVADGLVAAHQSGIIHRDLKPANLMMGADGKVKILDFGLAKAAEPEGDRSNPATSLSPTLTVAATAMGMIMGTAAYMSPEQARGKPVDARSDIWAFGCLLYEMLAGRRVFEGETVSDLLAAVLKTDPDWERLPDGTPPGVRRLLRRCLQRDPERRLHHMADARIELAEALEPSAGGAEVGGPSVVAASGRGVGPVLVAAGALLLGLAGGWLLAGLGGEPGSVPPPYRLSLLPPATSSFDMDTSPCAGTLSPDGTQIVFGVIDGEDRVSRLFVRDLSGGAPRPLPGTESAQYPFWSPDSRWVGFFSVGTSALKKVRADGGPPVRICEALNGKGGSWSADGTIIFAPTFGSPIHRVDAAGGEPQAITVIDTERHNSHRHPRFLEDGRHFVFFARSNKPDEPGAVMLGALDAPETRELLRSNTQAEVAPGYLLLEQDQVIQARAFDLATLTLSSEPEPLAEGVSKSTGASYAGFSAGGPHLAFNIQRGDARGSLEIRDRQGNTVSVLGDPGYFLAVLPSPDERRAVVLVEEGSGGSFELWLQDLKTGLRTRFTVEAGDQFAPTWSPDGRSVYYASNHEQGQFAIYRRNVGQIGQPEKVLESETSVYPMAVTAGGELVYTMAEDGVSLVMRVPLAQLDAEPRRVLEVNGFLPGVVLSPDARYLAYTSEESGRREVYVTDYPDASRRWLVSSRGGQDPLWTRDSGRLLFLEGQDQIMAAPLTVRNGEVAFGVPEPVVRSIARPTGRGSRAALLGNGDRVLMVDYPDTLGDSHIELSLNWRQALRDPK